MRGTSLSMIGNENLKRKWEIMNKYRYHNILIVIMAHMNSNMAWKIYSTLSSHAYFNVLE